MKRLIAQLLRRTANRLDPPQLMTWYTTAGNTAPSSSEMWDLTGGWLS